MSGHEYGPSAGYHFGGYTMTFPWGKSLAEATCVAILGQRPTPKGHVGSNACCSGSLSVAECLILRNFFGWDDLLD